MAATLEHIRSSLALDQILTTTVTEVQQLLKADRVLIYRLSPDGTGKVVAEAVNSAWSTTLDMTLPEESFPRECYQFYCQGQPRVVHNVVQHEWAECLLEFLEQLGVKSEVIAPIVQSVEQGDKIQNHLWGLLIIHACSDYREWQPEEVDLLTYLTKHLAIAIQQAELYQQVQVELTLAKQMKPSGRPQGDEALDAPFAQEEIRVNQSREIQLQAIFESAFEAIVITNDEGFYVEANPAACQLFGVPLSQLLGKNVGSFMEAGFDVELAWRTFQQQGQATGELRILRPDGTVREVEYAAKANFLPGLHLSVLRDITERKQAEEIRLAWEAQKELTRVQLHFFSMASHEFRTPLGAILGSAQILESAAQSCSDSKRIKNIQRIKAAAKNLTQLLDDILTINRAETGKLAVKPRPIDLEKFCQNLVEEMQLIAGSKTPITFVSQGQCQKASLDEKLLRYILTNLLSNAMNYSPQGGDIQLALTCERKAVTFQIKDHGIGIPSEDQNHLFELFHRGKNIENIPGRGLGLSVVKKSVELQGGKISLQSQEGVGTTVTVTIPQ
jgi:PAS domain S-box-containing protein